MNHENILLSGKITGKKCGLDTYPDKFFRWGIVDAPKDIQPLAMLRMIKQVQRTCKNYVVFDFHARGFAPNMNSSILVFELINPDGEVVSTIAACTDAFRDVKLFRIGVDASFKKSHPKPLALYKRLIPYLLGANDGIVLCTNVDDMAAAPIALEGCGVGYVGFVDGKLTHLNATTALRMARKQLSMFLPSEVTAKQTTIFDGQ